MIENLKGHQNEIKPGNCKHLGFLLVVDHSVVFYETYDSEKTDKINQYSTADVILCHCHDKKILLQFEFPNKPASMTR